MNSAASKFPLSVLINGVICVLLTMFSNEANGDRMVLRADVVRDFMGMCYDVQNCVARAVNETWNIGPCAIAKCERHDNGMLLEVRLMCPRFHKHIRAKCDYIEDLKLPFPQCCPHTVCKKDWSLVEKISAETQDPRSVSKKPKKSNPEKDSLHHLPTSMNGHNVSSDVP